MSRLLIVGHVRLVGLLAVAATLAMASLPALAQSETTGGDCSAIRFEVANPAPGSRVDPGNYVLQGVALDSRAEGSTGIDRIDFFIGSRDQGGVIVGRVVPGAVEMFEPFGPNSFETTVSVPSMPGGRDLFAYAHSTVTDQESIISMPIAVGVEPSKAGDSITKPPTMNCTPAQTAGAAAAAEPGSEAAAEPGSEAPAEEAESGSMAPAEMPLPEEMPAPEEVVAPVEMAAPEEMAPPEEMAAPTMSLPEESAAMPPAGESPTSRMFFNVGNPSPGDNLHVGGYMIEGIAFDRSVSEGHGISRIDVFLGNRDKGGVLIGKGELGALSPVPDDPQLADAGWRAQVTIPTNMTGPRTMFFYAQSGTTGGEIVTTIPVLVLP